MKIFIAVSLLLISFFVNAFPQSGWQQQSISLNNYSLTSVFPVSQSLCFASAENITTFENYYTIYKTTNSGLNWIQIANSTGWFIKNIKFVDSLNGFAVGGLSRLYMTENQYGKVVLKTTNGGLQWSTAFQLIFTPGFEMEFMDLSFANISTGYVTGRDGSIIKTTNNGVNFTTYYTAPNFKKSSISFVGPLYGWTAGDSGRIAYTINGGLNWSTLNTITTSHLKSITFNNLNIGYVCGNNGVIFKSTNGGLNWISLNSGVTANLNSVYMLNADTVWVAGINIILKTTNGGLNWITQYNAIPSSLNCIRFYNSNVGWACGGNKMLYTNSGGVTSLKSISSEIPSEYFLSQNYPNPFNPVTKISFSIPSGGFVILNISDLFGREVLPLVNRKLSAGTYELTINALGMTSGIYFYRMSASAFVITKKMILLK